MALGKLGELRWISSIAGSLCENILCATLLVK